MKFYKCAVCGKIITLQDGDDNIPTVCCGQQMKEYLPNTTEGAGEKHLPTYSYKDKDTLVVSIGAIVHPSMENHYIKWILLETNKVEVKEPNCIVVIPNKIRYASANFLASPSNAKVNSNDESISSYAEVILLSPLIALQYFLNKLYA